MKQLLSVFDLDRTLLSQNSSYHFFHYLYSQGLFSLIDRGYALYCALCCRWFDLSLRELHQKIVRHLLKGISLQQLELHIEGFLASFLKEKIYLPAFEALRLAQHLGHYTLILSNSPTLLVGPIARFFRVDEWQGTEYLVDKDQMICDIAHLMEGESKAHYLLKTLSRLQIPKENVTAYSDSHADLPLLLEAGEVVVVNPDSKLLKLSQQHHWRII